MQNHVPHAAPSRKRSALDYTSRELRLMFAASDALLNGRRSGLNAAELEEAEQLLNGLDTSEPSTAADEDPNAEPHDPDCACWLHDDEHAYRDDDEADDIEQQIAAVRRVA